jgi:predicted molibdopterin-dependent oxidoreductase YjgC
MHYREASANLLTHAALDPYAHIPEFKVCAVRVKRALTDAWDAPASERSVAVQGD